MNAPRQLALALPHAESFAREDFLTGATNEAALAMIERWPDWPDRALALVGPEGAGKSHLAAIWAETAGARRVSARALGQTDLIGALATGALVIEDAPARLDERALFHLLNLIREEEACLLITARAAPARWGVALPDLASRLRAVPTVALSAPDDALLRAVLVKLFDDRQLLVEANIIDYVARRIDRSLDATRAIVARLDGEALARGRRITRAMAAAILNEPGESGDDEI